VPRHAQGPFQPRRQRRPRHLRLVSTAPRELKRLLCGRVEGKARVETYRAEGLEGKGINEKPEKAPQACDREERAPSSVCCEEDTSAEQVREGRDGGGAQAGTRHMRIEGVILGRQNLDIADKEEGLPQFPVKETYGTGGKGTDWRDQRSD
jgi:hypothetical protein